MASMVEKIKRILPKIGNGNDAGRVAWLTRTIKSIPSGSKILDAGAGTGRFKYLCEHLEYVSQDFSQYNGKGDGLGLQQPDFNYGGRVDIVSDIVSIPRPDGEFDVILCTEVFEHIPDPIAAMKEFSRLLKKGGELIITAPFTSGVHMSPYYFYSGFSKYFYEYHLDNSGFDITEIKPNGNFFEFVAQEIRRTPFMGKKYSSGGFSVLFYPFLLSALWVLDRLNKREEGSSAFICYGYFVLAKKR